MKIPFVVVMHPTSRSRAMGLADHISYTRQLNRKERMEVLLEDKNTLIYEGEDSFDIIVLD